MKYLIYRASPLLVALLLISLQANAQFQVSGTVSDESGESLIGVSILVKGTTRGTISDIDGNYTIDVPGSSAILEFSYTGFKTEFVDVSPSNATLNVTLREDITNLAEVVVTGLASTIKRSNLANAVSKISSAELTGVTTQSTVDGALYGKLTGVNIVQNNGAPGGGIAVRLRGVSSLSGNNQPLIILDGVYITNAEIPSGSRFASGANSGSEEGASNRIADINPGDIESIEVLKGASAAAIYGTRANAGVIILTTKKGVAGKTRLNLSQDFGFNTIQKKVGRRSLDSEAEVAEVYPNDPDAPAQWAAARAAGRLFDYEKEIYGETGFISDTRLNVSGGNDRTKYFISGAYRTEDGIIKNTGYDRFTTRMNIDHKVSDKLNISSTSNYVRSVASRSFTGNENEGGLSYGYTLAFTRDYVDLFPDEDGVYPNNPNYAGNPIFVRDQARNEESNNRFIQGVKLDWKAFQEDTQVLRFTLTGGLDFLFNDTYVYVPETHQAQVDLDNGFIGVGKNTIFNYNYQLFGSYDSYADGGLSFSTQAGISYLSFARDFVFNQTTQLITLQTNLTQGGRQEISQRIEPEQEFGFIAQEQINWDDKLIATVGVRFDKSNLNGNPNKFYAFPRASIAANFANFDSWNSTDVGQFKLRIAYGETGNSASFGSLFTSLEAQNINGGLGYAILPQKGNPDLIPETSSELEFGTDLALFNNKLGIELTYYIRQVQNLLYDRAVPSSSGFTSEIRNDLNMDNRGLELGLTINPVRTSNFDWVSNVNFWFNDSEITLLGTPGNGTDSEDISSFVPTGVAFGLGLGSFYINEGTPITALWGTDANGNPIIKGDTEPDFQLGWFNQFKIGKRVDFNFLTHWKQGGDVLNLSRLLTDIGGVTPENLLDLDGFIEDASYFRLREIGLYYTLPFASNYIENIRFGISGRNLITLTDYSSYDPETSTKGGTGLSTGIEVTPFPSSRQAYFHINFNF